MKLLVTGASGLVGRNLAETLCDEYALLRPSHSELDLRNEERIRKYLQTNLPDLIIHCAGVVGGIEANVREPVRFFLHNYDIGRNTIWAARKVGIPRIINMGSSCMYPRDAASPLKEDMILKGELEPTNEGYALAKISTQRLCQYISLEDRGLKYKTIIPCNLYGKWDKFDPKYSHMVPAAIRKLHVAMSAGTKDVEIWGDGSARREFMYAGDLADFIRYAIARYDDMPDLMNVGVGYDYSIDDYYKIIADLVGYRGSFSHDITKPEGMRQKLVDISKLRSFGWDAKTSIREGLYKTYQFYLRQEKDQK